MPWYEIEKNYLKNLDEKVLGKQMPITSARRQKLYRQGLKQNNPEKY